jgi:hypothetical protein
MCAQIVHALAVAFALTATSCVSARPAAQPIHPHPAVSWGLGLSPIGCAEWRADEAKRKLGEQWLLGYFSGINSESLNSRGWSFGARYLAGDLVALVDGECSRNPEMTFRTAVSRVLSEIRKEGHYWQGYGGIPVERAVGPP